MTTGDNGTVPGSTPECVGKHTKLTDKQMGTETKNGRLQMLLRRENYHVIYIIRDQWNN